MARHKTRLIRGLMRNTLVAAVVTAGLASSASAQTAAKEIFGRVALPAVSEPETHGFYSKGCIAGAVAMPVDGPTWQAMRLERNRRWGHPKLITLLQDLSAKAAADDGWPGLLVGDISQPRGGPMLTGHASHQVGLDADIWLTPMPDRRLTQQERRDTSAISMLQDNGNSLYVDNNRWTAAHGKLLKRAASYGDVERMFVHPGIKKKLCETFGSDNANDFWMIKIRPYYGHHYHFHIRMKCQAGSPNCKSQDPVPASGNGCDQSLDWWFTSEPWTPKKPDPDAKPVKRKIVTVADLPKACATILNAPQPADESLVTLTGNYSLEQAKANTVPSAVPDPKAIALSRLPVPDRRPVQ